MLKADGRKIRLGLPKGSLQESTLSLFQKAGFKVSVSSRSYFPFIDDEEITPVLLRAQEIGRYVYDGALDCGITGEDWVRDNGVFDDIVKVVELQYAKQTKNRVRWVIAVDNDSEINSIADLSGKRIATELVNVTKEFLNKNGINADIEFSWGATEVKVKTGLVDAIVDITETGASLKANNLRIVDTICYSNTVLIANKEAWEDDFKRRKIESIALLLEGALRSDGKVGIKFNIKRADLPNIESLIPAITKPTISNLTDENWVAVESIMDENCVKSLIPQLKQMGAEGIIEYPLNKVVP